MSEPAAPLVVSGPSGSGKSALLANWLLHYRRRLEKRPKHGGASEKTLIFCHAVGQVFLRIHRHSSAYAVNGYRLQRVPRFWLERLCTVAYFMSPPRHCGDWRACGVASKSSCYRPAKMTAAPHPWHVTLLTFDYVGAHDMVSTWTSYCGDFSRTSSSDLIWFETFQTKLNGSAGNCLAFLIWRQERGV